ncbi:hypothetical protein LCGC14_1794060 [marine sediment metagenome]|uniref:HTH cro/C1-type domain-containing protein n=1 Tax=marine sediment metagenome TaxID=412755 RepID=A0A0F9GRP8_9ZZZZ
MLDLRELSDIEEQLKSNYNRPLWHDACRLLAEVYRLRAGVKKFKPGELIQEEIIARGWTQNDLAGRLRCPPSWVHEVIAGTAVITPSMAQELGKTFGTSDLFWTRLELAYRPHATDESH